MDRQQLGRSPGLGQEGDGAVRRRRRQRGWLTGALALSLAAHLSLVAALLLIQMGAPVAPEAAPVTVDLVRWPPPAPVAPAASQQKAAAAIPPPPRRIEPPIPPPPDIKPLVASRSTAAESGPGLSDAELAGAATAGSAGGGGSCDMARRVQDALRKDPLVRAAAASISGKAIMVWNGDWVRSNAEEGKGLAAVREAILWEVAFAPAACRTQPVHGLVMISLNEPPYSTRLVVGQGEWRWSDLLTPRAYHGEG